MRKLRNFFSFTLIIGLTLMTAYGSALALNATDHVSVAPNGKGDVLIFPAYFTGAGWQTKLTVINTSLTQSVVAKVVIRSKENSQEIRDFMIFLTPTDVWTGVLAINAGDGLPHITSTDDSVLATNDTFASPANPFDIFLEAACSGDTNELGYVEVIQGASFNLGAPPPPVSKTALRAAYDSWVRGSLAGVLNPINVLAGNAEITNSISGQAYSLNALALKNHQWIPTSAPMDVRVESFLGDVNSNNNLMEVEAALSKNALAVPFYAGTSGMVFSTFTFPTKLNLGLCAAPRARGPFFVQYTPSPEFSLQAFDLSENTTTVTGPFLSPPQPTPTNRFPSELNFVGVGAVPGAFEEGWMLFTISGGPTSALAKDGLTGISYTGAPVIGTYMRFNDAGQAGWLYAPHDNGVVSVNGVADLQYQYFGQTDF